MFVLAGAIFRSSGMKGRGATIGGRVYPKLRGSSLALRGFHALA